MLDHVHVRYVRPFNEVQKINKAGTTVTPSSEALSLNNKSTCMGQVSGGAWGLQTHARLMPVPVLVARFPVGDPM